MKVRHYTGHEGTSAMGEIRTIEVYDPVRDRWLARADTPDPVSGELLMVPYLKGNKRSRELAIAELSKRVKL